MHLYTKKNIDTAYHQAIFQKPKVVAVKLSIDDIDKYKSHYKNEDFENYINETYSYIPPRKKIKPNEKGTDVLKLVLSREGETDKFKSQFKSILNNEKENTSTITTETTKPMDVCDESAECTESKNSPDTSLHGLIKLRDIKTMMDDHMHMIYLKNFECNKVKISSTNGKRSVISTIIPTNGSYSTVIRGNLSLCAIEKLYNKYFSKIVQDAIVIIANILNIISMSNKHHKARMDESFKKRTEAEKLKERCDANRQHLRHKKVLEAKLKQHFMEVVSTFIDAEFEPTFQMFFLSILTVLRVLDQPKFKKGSIFKNLVLLLWNSLKNSEFDHPKVFSMFRSKSFRPDCIDLISLIEDSRDSDPGITDRMALFFVSTVNSQEYFKAVIDAVTSDSNEELALLIDKAAIECRTNSKFKDPKDYSFPIANKCVITTKSPNSSIQNNVKIQNDGVKHWVIAQTTNGTYQPIPMSNEGKIQKTGNITLESTSTSLPLNTYYETFSNSLLTRVSSDTITPKMIAPKVNVVASSTVASTSSGQTATIVAFKPTANIMKHNIKPITTSIQRTEGNTIYVGNKQYQLIRGPMSQMKALTTQTMSNSIVIRAQPRPPITEVSVKCFATNCTNPATIMCSSCTSVKYCSHNCQRLDWYESHINNCERLQSIQQQRISKK